jgi:CRISPR-associated protein Cas1
MRKLLNTLYVTMPDAYLSRDGENVVVKAEGAEKARVPIHNLESIVCFNYTGTSPSLMALCCERGVTISYISEHQGFLARVTGRVSGNVLLRRQQYRMADDPCVRTLMARSFVTGKLMNCRSVLLRFMRDHGHRAAVDKAAAKLLLLCGTLQSQTEVDSIRGIEGEAAGEYYAVLNELILSPNEDFEMRGRNRRPPLDRMNALLSFLYTLLANECASALESVGLDPQVGFLHVDRSGRSGLALDLMEELRPHLADRMVLTLINSRQVAATGFVLRETGAVLMDTDTRKAVIVARQKRKLDEVVHPFLGEKIELGLIPYSQALLLARYVRGDLDGYPPFMFR